MILIHDSHGGNYRDLTTASNLSLYRDLPASPVQGLTPADSYRQS